MHPVRGFTTPLKAELGMRSDTTEDKDQAESADSEVENSQRQQMQDMKDREKYRLYQVKLEKDQLFIQQAKEKLRFQREFQEEPIDLKQNAELIKLKQKNSPRSRGPSI